MTVGIYAHKHGLLDTPGWMFKGIKKMAKTHKRIIRRSNQATHPKNPNQSRSRHQALILVVRKLQMLRLLPKRTALNVEASLFVVQPPLLFYNRIRLAKRTTGEGA